MSNQIILKTTLTSGVIIKEDEKTGMYDISEMFKSVNEMLGKNKQARFWLSSKSTQELIEYRNSLKMNQPPISADGSKDKNECFKENIKLEEVWKPVVGYEDLYEVSNLGNVRRISGYIKARGNSTSYHKGCILKPIPWKKGYIKYCLTKDGKPKRYFAHRLVAEAFLPNQENKPQVDHINTIKDDNRVENLRWVTQSENQHNKITYSKIIEHANNNNPFKDKHHSNTTKKRISDLKSKEVMQITIDNKVVGIWRNMRDAAEYLGCSFTSIHRVLTHKNKTAFGYKWIYSSEYFIARPHCLVFDWSRISSQSQRV